MRVWAAKQLFFWAEYLRTAPKLTSGLTHLPALVGLSSIHIRRCSRPRADGQQSYAQVRHKTGTQTANSRCTGCLVNAKTRWSAPAFFVFAAGYGASAHSTHLPMPWCTRSPVGAHIPELEHSAGTGVRSLSSAAQ